MVVEGIEISNRPTGARRMSIEMLEARQRADGFVGCRAGTAKPLTYLAAFQEAEPYLGLPALAYKLVAWLVKQTMACDWEAGSRPIAWPSAQRQSEFLNLSPARVKAINRVLFEAGVFVIRDNPQGRRYGRRGPDKRIVEAYGFDLSPLAQRYDEFVRIAAEARAERDRMKALRARVTIARRGIFQAGETLAGTGRSWPEGWSELAAEASELVAAGRRASRSVDLAVIATALESRQLQAEQWVSQASKSVETNPLGLENEPHIISTNPSFNPKDTVPTIEESSRVEPPPLPPERQSPPQESGSKWFDRPSRLLDLMPRLAQYIPAAEPGWSTIVDAAGGPLRREMDVSAWLWEKACRVLGREGAALALGIVSAKAQGHFVRSAGGYFSGMIKKAEKGQLHLDRTLWSLREAKWGKAELRDHHQVVRSLSRHRKGEFQASLPRRD